MADKFFGKGTSSPVASGNMSPTNPASLAVNDILFCFITQHDSVVATMPVNWTRVTNFPIASGTAVKLDCFWKRVTSTGESGATVTVTRAAGDAGIAVICAFRGLTTSGNPFNTSATQANASSATVTMPTVTPSAAGQTIIFVGGMSDDGNFGVVSGADPAPAERHDELTALGLDCAILVATGERSVSTATGARTSTNVRAAVNVGGQIALTTASGGTTTNLTGGPLAGAYTETGTAATFKLTTPAGASSYVLTGAAVTTQKRIVSTADSTAYTLSGSATTATLTVPAGSGSYTLTGSSVGTSKSTISAVAGATYTLTGSSVFGTLITPMGSGSYALTGSGITTLKSIISTMGSGTLTVAGTSATATLTMPMGSGSHLWTGSAAATSVISDSPVLTALSGTFTLAGSSITTQRSIFTTPASGAYTLSGSSVVLRASFNVLGETTNYQLNGAPILMSYSGGTVVHTCRSGLLGVY